MKYVQANSRRSEHALPDPTMWIMWINHHTCRHFPKQDLSNLKGFHKSFHHVLLHWLNISIHMLSTVRPGFLRFLQTNHRKCLLPSRYMIPKQLSLQMPNNFHRLADPLLVWTIRFQPDCIWMAKLLYMKSYISSLYNWNYNLCHIHILFGHV